MVSGSSEAYVTVFKPATPGKDDRPQIWNDQLLQYAAWGKTTSIDTFADNAFSGEQEIVGDPKNVSFVVDMCNYTV
jgi:nitric oxide synthase oxygenase domain/subunit